MEPLLACSPARLLAELLGTPDRDHLHCLAGRGQHDLHQVRKIGGEAK
jgi:hypothetical protein